MPAHHLYNCLQCGRCKAVCPVQIDTTQLRMNEWQTRQQTLQVNHSYLPKPQVTSTTRVAYFQGCMGHLTPSVTRAMMEVFKAAKQDVVLVDADRSICCGRPMQRTGLVQQAETLLNKCVEHIAATNADLLVTACPICYRQFAQLPHVSFRVMHHTEYLYELIASENITLSPLSQTAVYHDPCELSRNGNALYNQPRAVLQKIVSLQHTAFERDNSLCCGASLANTDISTTQRAQITQKVVSDLLTPQTEVLVTSCNLCKKTLQAQSPVAVKDIAELVRDAMV
jgi:Fe-S oxidoreductase